jgi:hypothetical protein
LAAFYASVANEGALPHPHAIDSIEQDGKTVFTLLVLLFADVPIVGWDLGLAQAKLTDTL